MEFMWQNAKTVICNMSDKLKINFLYIGLHTDQIKINLNLKKIMTKLPYLNIMLIIMKKF